MRIPRTPLMLIAVAAFALPTACGGDDDGGGGSALSDEAFCARILALEETSDEPDENFVAELRSLRDSAPNNELRGAIGTFVDFFEATEALDPSDPDELEELLELSTTSDLDTASDVLDDYTENTCGFDLDE